MRVRAVAILGLIAAIAMPSGAGAAEDDVRLDAFKACHFDFSVAKAILHTLEVHYPDAVDIAALRDEFETERKDFGAAYLRYALQRGVDVKDSLGDPTPSDPQVYQAAITQIETAHADRDAEALKTQYDEAVGCHPVK